MTEKRRPIWVPYSPPRVYWYDRALYWARRYGFLVALSVSMMLFAVLLWWVSGQDAYTPSSQAADLISHSSSTTLVDGVNSYQGMAELYVFAAPRGASVQVDNQEAMSIPLLGYELSAGAHQITITREGYAPIDTMVLLRSDRVNRLTFMMEEESAVSTSTKQAESRSFPVAPGEFERARASQREQVQEIVAGLGLADSTRMTERRRSLRNRVGW